MDTRDGRIYTQKELEKFKAVMVDKKEAENLKEMKIAPTRRQLSRNPPKVGRNEPCPCGSGTKFKKCCLRSQG